MTKCDCDTVSPAEGQAGGGGNGSDRRCARWPGFGFVGVSPPPLSSFTVRNSQETKGIRPIRIAEALKWKFPKGWNGKNRRDPLIYDGGYGGKIPVDGAKWMG